MTPHVVVVGGGIAGLAAAHEMRRATQAPQVTVLEGGARLGGAIHTGPFAGTMLDEAADGFLARVPWATDLCRDLGLGDELVSPATRTARVFSRGELRPFPTDQVLGVPLALDELAATGIVDERGVDQYRAAVSTAGPEPDHDVPLADALARQVGDAVAQRLVAPLVGGINAGDIARLSLDAVTPQLAGPARHPDGLVSGLNAERADHPPDPTAPVFHALPGGMGRLIETLAETLAQSGATVETERPVTGLATKGERLELVDGSGRTLTADGVVLAAGAEAGARLLTGVAPLAADLLKDIEHASVALLSLAVDPDAIAVDLDASGFVVPAREGIDITACSWSSAKWAHLGSGRHALLRAFLGRHGAPDVLVRSDQDLITTALADLGTTMGLEGDPVAVRVSRWPRSLPQYAPGHLDRVDQIDAALEAQGAPVVATGAAFRGIGIPACIREGQSAGRRLVERLAT